MRCTEVADRPFPDGKFTCRDIGDRWRSSFRNSDAYRESLRTSNGDDSWEDGRLRCTLVPNSNSKIFPPNGNWRTCLHSGRNRRNDDNRASQTGNSNSADGWSTCLVRYIRLAFLDHDPLGSFARRRISETLQESSLDHNSCRNDLSPYSWDSGIYFIATTHFVQ